MEEQEVFRVRLPKGKEIIGKVIALLGGSRFLVLCKDEKERVCRIPGRFKRRFWVKEGDYVLVEPWEIESDKKGDIIWKYRPNKVQWLKKKGYIDG